MTYNLLTWKRIPKFDNSVCSNKAKDYWSTVILDADDKEIKEALLKIELDQTYEVNL